MKKTPVGTATDLICRFEILASVVSWYRDMPTEWEEKRLRPLSRAEPSTRSRRTMPSLRWFPLDDGENLRRVLYQDLVNQVLRSAFAPHQRNYRDRDVFDPLATETIPPVQQ